MYRVGTESAWTVRVVPNLYPAFERQEVVGHSPRHVRTFAGLSDDEIAAVAQAWRARFDAAQVEGFAYVHALINEGAAAGSSLAHSHSQLVWLREVPPAIAAERGSLPAADAGLVVSERGAMTAAVHAAGRLPYELLISGSPFDLETCARSKARCHGTPGSTSTTSSSSRACRCWPAWSSGQGST